MRIALLVLVAALSACAGTDTRGTGEGASCAAPQVSVMPGAVVPGTPFDVTGTLLYDSCQDTVANGSIRPTPQPLSGLTVLLVQGAEHWTLADGLAGQQDGMLHVTVTVPDDARLADGAAEIAVGGVGAPVVVVRP